MEEGAQQRLDFALMPLAWRQQLVRVQGARVGQEIIAPGQGAVSIATVTPGRRVI